MPRKKETAPLRAAPRVCEGLRLFGCKRDLHVSGNVRAVARAARIRGKPRRDNARKFGVIELCRRYRFAAESFDVFTVEIGCAGSDAANTFGKRFFREMREIVFVEVKRNAHVCCGAHVRLMRPGID